MKKKSVAKQLAILLAICLISGFALSACKHTSEHPRMEHPGNTKTNAPGHTP